MDCCADRGSIRVDLGAMEHMKVLQYVFLMAELMLIKRYEDNAKSACCRLDKRYLNLGDKRARFARFDF